MRIEHSFDAAHQIQLHLSYRDADIGLLHQANTVLARDGEDKLKGDQAI